MAATAVSTHAAVANSGPLLGSGVAAIRIALKFPLYRFQGGKKK